MPRCSLEEWQTSTGVPRLQLLPRTGELNPARFAPWLMEDLCDYLLLCAWWESLLRRRLCLRHGFEIAFRRTRESRYSPQCSGHNLGRLLEGAHGFPLLLGASAGCAIGGVMGYHVSAAVGDPSADGPPRGKGVAVGCLVAGLAGARVGYLVATR